MQLHGTINPPAAFRSSGLLELNGASNRFRRSAVALSAAPRRRPVPLFALLGAVSGIATVAILLLNPDWHLTMPGGVDLRPLSVVPGLVFGFVIGLAFYARGRASLAAFLGYMLAVTFANYAAVTLTTDYLVDVINAGWLAGIVAGLFGAACLAAFTVALLPVARKPRPVVLTLLAGAGLGALLGPVIAAEGLIWWFLFYGLWQSACAASLATALPRR